MKSIRGIQYESQIRPKVTRKIPLTATQIAMKWISWRPQLIFLPTKLMKKVKTSQEQRTRSLEIIRQNDELTQELGIISLQPLTQQTFQSLRRHINQLDTTQVKHIAREYCNCCKRLWKIGVYEYTWEFIANYGMDAQGRVRLLDVGELHQQKKEVRNHILNRQWRNSWSYRHHLKRKHRAPFDEILVEELTPSVLDATWPN